MSLLLIDIDYFKSYNDHYGHQQGDECLHRVAQVLSAKLMRGTDFIARYGGEEFVCVLPDTGLEHAVRQAEALRLAVESAQLPHEKPTVSNFVTVSVGVGCLVPEQKTLVSELVSQADQALYMAKSQGRNRVCTMKYAYKYKASVSN